MGTRLELHNELCTILGSKNVYFQPPDSVNMNYPAIVYYRDNISSNFADDTVYMQFNRYKAIVIDKDPDGIISDRVSKMPRCQFDRHYIVNNLNHDVFIIYY